MNKLERKLLKDKKETRTNNLWVGMMTESTYKPHKQHNKPLSYRMKVYERDNLKLEREDGDE